MGQGRAWIGISGWRYAPWRGRFYPRGLAQRHELAYAARALPSIELNGSHYALQRPASFQAWHDATPEEFVFAVKGPRFITHMLRLREARTPLARRHDQRLRAPALLRVRAPQRRRHALEVRHESFVDPGCIALLRRHGVALVVADTAGRWPLCEDLTADFVYLRLHGDRELYASGYGDAALDGWAARIAAWRAGGQPADARRASPRAPRKRARRDVYCYFDNDVKVHAPYDAARLAARLGVPTGLDAQGRYAGPPVPPP